MLILTGASGTGKTIVAQALATARSDVKMIFFDSIGVPDAGEMAAFGPEQWQRATTIEWTKRLAPLVTSHQSVLFEGQMRLAFIHEALAAAGIANARILLFDCDDAVRVDRLTHERRQPELANEQMLRWASYLREEATRAGSQIVDTGRLSIGENVARVSRYLPPTRSAGESAMKLS